MIYGLFQIPKNKKKSLTWLILKNKKNNTMKKFNIFQAATTLTSIIPSPNDPPYLLAIGNDSYNNKTLMCYTDGICAFSANGFDAVLLLISLYWVFNISFPSCSKLQFSLLAIAIMRETGVNKGLVDILKMGVFTKTLTRIGLTE